MIDLRFDHVSKRYRIPGETAEDSWRGNGLGPWLRRLRRRSQEFWAVRDVSFEVRRGEAVGIIGHNGAGKSTILKLLSNITTPTVGEITINGRLSALIEVGSGFHPELTGRENIYLSGSILGMRRREIGAKLDRIVEFAGIREFIDVPVKRYSSGMYVRLGFSIAAHLEPDVLLLDEVLAVGDAAFQAKCLQRIQSLKEGGTTIVFISHDLAAVERMCDRVLLMQRGEQVASGAPREVIAEYRRTAFRSAPVGSNGDEADLPREAECVGVTFCDSEGREASAWRTGDALRLRVRYVAHVPVEDAIVSVFFYSSENEKLCCEFTTGLGRERIDLDRGSGTIEFLCRELSLQPGDYHVDMGIERDPNVVIDWRYHGATLRVNPGRIVRGPFYMPHEWRVVPELHGDGRVQAEESLARRFPV
jgi:ABC-type polysaccharide/polyol phosphate transport system ATPase subunit